MGFLSLDDPFADEDGVPFMPSFEGDDGEDRPFAPPADEYPIGCEAELRDIAFAKVAQTEEKWEPFMDQLFSVHRRRVIVRRHLGEYSFVICSDERGFELIGMTLYRACLSEPKVKMTKYYANSDKQSPKNLMDMMDDDSDLREELKKELHTSSESGATFADDTTSGKVAIRRRLDAGDQHGSSGLTAGTDPENKSSDVSIGVKAGANRNNFAIAMKFGTREIERRNYAKAIRYYNFALKEAPQEEARVLCSRSVAFLQLHEIERALKDAQRAIELEPDNHVGYVRAGNILRARKEFEQAKMFYQKALEKSPSDPKLQKLYADNCVAMLYDLRTKKFPYLRVTHHEVYKRAVVVTTQKVPSNATLLVETTTLTCVAPLKSGLSRGCGHCCQSFLNGEEVIKAVPGLQPEILHRLHHPFPPVCCRYCNIPYCSDKCRTRAWAEHHWVECRSRGTWRRGLREMDQYLEQYVGERMELPTDIINDNSPTSVAACCHIAVRMMSRMSSCVFALSEAIEMYNWLQISPSVASRRGEVGAILRTCFDFIKKGFSGEAVNLLTYELFEKCYERAKSNALGIYISPWESIRRKAQEEINLLQGSVLENADLSGSLPEIQTREQLLQTIVDQPPKGPPGAYLYALCVFELQALTWTHIPPCNPPENAHLRRPALLIGTETPNVEIGSFLRTSASISVRSTQQLESGTILSSSIPKLLW